MAILTRLQQLWWWQGANERIAIVTKPQSGLWAKIRKSFYDMGQNIGVLVRRLTGYKMTFLQIPGHENCSSLVSSIVSCGFEKMPNYGPNWLHDLMGVKETSQVAPSHFGMVPDAFRKLRPGEKIRDGCVILCLRWDAVDFGLGELINRLRKVNPRHYKILSEIFRDGIRITQRDILKHDDPYWRATHAMFKSSGDDEMMVVSQEEIAKVKIMRHSEVVAGTLGKKPEYIVLVPIFLYGLGN